MSMRSKFRSRLTYANVMATIAVFLVLGGSSYAALQISGKDIKNRSIAGKKLKKHTVGRTELKSGLPFQRNAKWALVNSSGNIVAQSGGISVSQHSGGNYYLNFGSSLKGKPIIATAADVFTGSGRVGVQTAVCGGGAAGAVCPAGVNTAKHAYVLTTDETQPSFDQPEGFYVVTFP